MMIKWGRRKKQQPPSSPRPSLLSSLLLRLKKMGGGTGTPNAAGHYNPTPPPPVPVKAACYRSRRTNHHNSPSTGQHEELYGGDEDFWRLSFRKEKVYSGYETEEEEDEAFTEMVSGIRRMKELQKITSSEKLKEREVKSMTPRRKILIKSSSPSSTSTRRRRRRRKKGIINHVKQEEEEEEEEEDYVFRVGGGESCDSGDERSRKSVYVNRASPKRRSKKQGISCRVRVVSPRIGRAAEVVNSSSISKEGGLERFAVVKCSLDPERDFRESMVEMILERNICGAQQLEDLLACYLALNSDHYHHLIIKVFRQIWFHFNN